MRPLASRISQLNGEGALAVFSRAKELEKQGRSIIHLELGEPDFHPAAPIVDAVRAAVAQGRDRYVSPVGIPALREAVAAYLKRTRRLDVSAQDVLIPLRAASVPPPFRFSFENKINFSRTLPKSPRKSLRAARC
jgi:aspartate/methionine/tyrosine aminotransferase